MRKYLFLALTLPFGLYSQAQISHIYKDIGYKIEISSQFGTGSYTPFWQTANQYGLATTQNNSGYLRTAFRRDADADSLRKWRLGYGADFVVPISYDSKFILQQLYADFQFRAIRLSVGQKERPLELKNSILSSGAMTLGTNARPLPQIRLELPDFWAPPKLKNWLAIKGHIAYGWFTDNKWQKRFNANNASYVYTANSLYHSKAGYLRLGNKEKFPVTLTGGIEMVCQFGGEAWNLSDRADHTSDTPFDSHQKLGSGIKDYFQAFIPTGSDVNDGDYANVKGNQLGSWHARLDYINEKWGAALYAEHFFEDHSQLGWQYAWKDMLYGVEINLPRNPVVSTLLYEHMRTTDQSGPVYHDATNNLPTSIAGLDNYYNHHIYGAYQHSGFVIGTPLIISPIYNDRIQGGAGRIFCYDSRITAHHFGIAGQPHNDLSYRVLYTHERSLGIYDIPRTKPAFGNFLLIEGTYRPHQIKGFKFTASYGQNGGELLGCSKGGMLTVSYSGWICKHNKTDK